MKKSNPIEEEASFISYNGGEKKQTSFSIVFSSNFEDVEETGEKIEKKIKPNPE